MLDGQLFVGENLMENPAILARFSGGEGPAGVNIKFYKNMAKGYPFGQPFAFFGKA